MPSFKEVQYYLSGLWLLIRMDARGFQYLDISDRGMLRSFWAILWSLPSIGIFWLRWQQAYLTAMPPETSTGLAFFLRLALVEAANWLIPPIFVGVLLLAFRFGDKFAPIVVTANWLFVPANYLNALLVAMTVFIPGSKELAALLSLALTMAIIFSLARILRMICGTHPLFVGTLTLMLLIPNLLLTDFLQRFLGVYPPG